jgi:membrane protein required for beta-lactamase induction
VCGRTGIPSLSGRIAGKISFEMNETSSRSFGRTVVATLILLVVGWLLLSVIGHVLSFLFGTVLLVVAVIAVIWALRVLL